MDSGEQVDGTNIPQKNQDEPNLSWISFIVYVYPKYFMLLSMLKFVTYL